MEYIFQYANNHPVVEIDGRSYVIDTGSPISFFINHHSGDLIINENSFCLPDNPLNIDRDGTEKLIGRSISGFIGLDVLERMGTLYMNRRTDRALFGSDKKINSGYAGDLTKKSVMGMSFLEIKAVINGREVNAILDSGACISYASRDLLNGGRYLGKVQDYSPSFGGEIQTDKYEVALSVCGRKCEAAVATMTEMIEMSVGLLGYKAILGFGEIAWDELLIDIKNGGFDFL